MHNTLTKLKNASQGNVIILQLHENNFRKILKTETNIQGLQIYMLVGI